MTAFASIIIAALPGLGAKSGADGAVTADGQAMAGQASGGVFEALMATLTGAAPAQPEAQAAAATSMPVPTAAVVPADLGPADLGMAKVMLPGLASEEALEDSLAVADNASPENAAAEALAAAGAVVVAQTPKHPTSPATTEAEPVVAPTVTAPPPRADHDATAEPPDLAAPVAAGVSAARPGVAAASSDLPPPVAGSASRGGPTAAGAPAAPTTVATTAPAATSSLPGGAIDTAAARPAPDAIAVADASADAALPPTIAAPRSATEAVTSLVGRILDGARKPETEAAVRQAAADGAPPVEASADGVVDTPVELAVDTALSPDAPVPGEAAVVEAPVVPASASSRRAARADAARVDVSGETAAPAAPDLKPDARPTANAAPAPLVRPEPSLAPVPVPVPVADTGAAPDQASLDATPAAPTLQAAAEAPPETAPTRGSPETVARLASDIARKLEGRTTRFDVQLDPLGLGKVDVSIEINADGRLSASLSFDSAQTAADLRGRAAELRQALEKAGFDLADGGLSFDMNNPGGSTGRETRETLAAWSSRAFQTARSGLEQADVLAARSPSSRTPSGGVDIRI